MCRFTAAVLLIISHSDDYFGRNTNVNIFTSIKLNLMLLLANQINILFLKINKCFLFLCILP